MGRPQPLPPPPTHPVTDHLIALGKQTRQSLRRINEYLVRWAMRKYKRLRGHLTRAVKWLANVARRGPLLFAHWRVGVRPDGWTVGAR